VKNSVDFMHILVSFDVVSLFTKVPTGDVLKLLSSKSDHLERIPQQWPS
jgi:hypothetical protein